MRLALVLMWSMLTGCGLLLDSAPPVLRSGATDTGPEATPGDAGIGDAAGIDGASSDAATPDGGAPRPSNLCGGPMVLTDAFSDGVRAPAWGQHWRTGDVTIEERSGQVRIQPGSAGGGYAGYRSTFAVDLRGDWVAVEIDGHVEGPASVTGLSVESPLGSSATISIEGDSIVATVLSKGGLPFSMSTTPHDAAAQPWIRIRETGGNLWFEASPDGVSWNGFASARAPAGMDAVWMEIFAGASDGSAGEARFDNFNLDPTGRVPVEHCPASSFVDDFDPRANTWHLYDPQFPGRDSGCTLADAPSATVLTLTGTRFCELGTASAYRLRDQRVFVEIEDLAPRPEGGRAYLTVFDRGYAKIFLWLDASEIRVQSPSQDVTVSLGDLFQPTRLAIGETGSVITLEVYDPMGAFHRLEIPAGELDTSAVGFGVGLDFRSVDRMTFTIGVEGFNTPL